MATPHRIPSPSLPIKGPAVIPPRDDKDDRKLIVVSIIVYEVKSTVGSFGGIGTAVCGETDCQKAAQSLSQDTGSSFG
jgi:hypothetical protein